MKEFLIKFNQTRRVKRRQPERLYGIEGEFYVDGKGNYGQDHTPDIIDYNKPPSTQPGLWNQWTPNDDGTEIIWDGGEKFYDYEEWIEYLIDKILAPNGYVLNGEVKWRGEEFEDIGTIEIKNNVVESRLVQW